jgi:hypothetical protein
MNDHTPPQGNAETRNFGPVQVFEDASGDLPPGTAATPRPPERPRELPPPPGAVPASLEPAGLESGA